MVFGISAFAWFFTSPLWGRYSDKFGTRIIAVIGTLGYSANMMLIILPLYLFENGILSSAMLFPALVASRLIYGLFGQIIRKLILRQQVQERALLKKGYRSQTNIVAR